MSFQARYPGHCTACDAPIDVGQTVEYDDAGRLVHTDCPELVDIDAPQRNERHCTQCFTVHAGDCL